jgi:uncharacterized ion transporter superfamily protein YfcC
VIAVRGVPWSDWLLLVVPLLAMAITVAYIVLVIP